MRSKLDPPASHVKANVYTSESSAYSRLGQNKLKGSNQRMYGGLHDSVVAESRAIVNEYR